MGAPERVVQLHLVMAMIANLMGRLPSPGLVLVPALALVVGLLAMLGGWANEARLIFAAGIVPVLGVLVITIIQSLRKGEFGLDIIAALAMGGALLGGETLAGVVVAMMFAGGQALEQFAQGRAQRDMTALIGRVARTAEVYRNGALQEVAIDLIRPGERLLIRTGEVLPVDGAIHSGEALLDESALSGEALAVRRSAGESVSSGVANAGRPFDLVASRTAAESTYAGVIRLVEQARLSKAPMARLADRYALLFLAITLVLAGAAWWFADDPRRALAVLVVATPCPLILAVPVAIVAGMSRAARRGVLIKSARVLELLPQTRSAILDKTGTLTDGYARIVSIEAREGFPENTVLQLAASLAQASQHVISRALVDEIRRKGNALTLPEQVVETHGDGVSGSVDQRSVVIGRPAFVSSAVVERDAFPPAKLAMLTPGHVVLAVAVDGRFAGRIVFADHIRTEAAATLAALRKSGIERIILLTGDQQSVAEHVGRSLGFDEIIAEASPAQKLAIVRREADLGQTMMVGDGINDAPALAAAHLGVALGARGAAAASEAADIVLLVDRLDRLAEAISIARRARRIAIQSVFFGIGLSTLGMVAAGLGYLTPVAGALIQEAIDVAVILNALRALSGHGDDMAQGTGAQPDPAPVT